MQRTTDWGPLSPDRSADLCPLFVPFLFGRVNFRSGFDCVEESDGFDENKRPFLVDGKLDAERADYDTTDLQVQIRQPVQGLAVLHGIRSQLFIDHPGCAK